MECGEGNSNPLQYSCLGNPMDTGAWWAAVHGVARVERDLATKSPPPPDGMRPGRTLGQTEIRLSTCFS